MEVSPAPLPIVIPGSSLRDGLEGPDPESSGFRVRASRAPGMTIASPKSLPPPFDQLGADFFRLFLLRPMAAAAHQVFLQSGMIFSMPSAADGGSTASFSAMIISDGTRRYGRGRPALPVARQVAIPVDAAGEAGLVKVSTNTFFSSGDRIGVRGSYLAS